jgi:hypothetical protein
MAASDRAGAKSSPICGFELELSVPNEGLIDSAELAHQRDQLPSEERRGR